MSIAIYMKTEDANEQLIAFQLMLWILFDQWVLYEEYEEPFSNNVPVVEFNLY